MQLIYRTFLYYTIPPASTNSLQHRHALVACVYLASYSQQLQFIHTATHLVLVHCIPHLIPQGNGKPGASNVVPFPPNCLAGPNPVVQRAHHSISSSSAEQSLPITSLISLLDVLLDTDVRLQLHLAALQSESGQAVKQTTTSQSSILSLHLKG